MSQERSENQSTAQQVGGDIQRCLQPRPHHHDCLDPTLPCTPPPAFSGLVSRSSKSVKRKRWSFNDSFRYAVVHRGLCVLRCLCAGCSDIAVCSDTVTLPSVMSSRWRIPIDMSVCADDLSPAQGSHGVGPVQMLHQRCPPVHGASACYV